MSLQAYLLILLFSFLVLHNYQFKYELNGASSEVQLYQFCCK